MATASEAEPQMLVGQGNNAITQQPIGSITLLYEDFDITDAVGVATPLLTGTVSRLESNDNVTGDGTLFVAELVGITYITYNNPLGGADTQVVSEIQVVDNNTLLTVIDGAIQPLSGATDFTDSNYATFDATTVTVGDTLTVDPTAISANKPAGERFYLRDFTAYNWNTEIFENLATTYATTNGQDVWDLGWDDEASWKVAVNALLAYGGWNATFTNVVPDTALIDNSNQEIVVYYLTDTQTYNGADVAIIDPMIFYEQSGIGLNYQTQLGGTPFQTLAVNFDAIDYNGVNFNIAGVQTAAGFGVVAKQGDRSVRITTSTTTYNAVAAAITFADQDFTPGQFEVFIKYTTYDGFEAIAARELVNMGVQVSPENVDWYRQHIEQLGEIEELEWPFDEEEVAPIEDEPDEYDPTLETPTDYAPPNIGQNEEGETDAD